MKKLVILNLILLFIAAGCKTNTSRTDEEVEPDSVVSVAAAQVDMEAYMKALKIDSILKNDVVVSYIKGKVFRDYQNEKKKTGKDSVNVTSDIKISLACKYEYICFSVTKNYTSEIIVPDCSELFDFEGADRADADKMIKSYGTEAVKLFAGLDLGPLQEVENTDDYMMCKTSFANKDFSGPVYNIKFYKGKDKLLTGLWTVTGTKEPAGNYFTGVDMDFNEFFVKFCNDRSFQLDHINFPLPDYIFYECGDNGGVKQKSPDRNGWVYYGMFFNGVKKNRLNPDLYERESGTVTKAGDSYIYRYENGEAYTSYSFDFTFKKVKGTWMLVSFEETGGC